MQTPDNHIKLSDYPLNEQPRLIKEFYKQYNANPIMFKTTVGQFLNIIETTGLYDLNEHTQETLNRTVFCFGYDKRSYLYDVEYVDKNSKDPIEYFNEDKRKMFEATKIFYFLKNPIDEFRAPFYLVNTDYTDNKYSLHGLFRTMMLPFVNKDIEMSMITVNESDVVGMKHFFETGISLLSLSDEELIKTLKLDLFSNTDLYIFHSEEIGIQIIELHSSMPEFRMPWKVEFNGKELLVNDCVVAVKNRTQFKIVNT